MSTPVRGFFFIKDIVNCLLNSHNFIPKQASELLHSRMVLG